MRDLTNNTYNLQNRTAQITFILSSDFEFKFKFKTISLYILKIIFLGLE